MFSKILMMLTISIVIASTAGCVSKKETVDLIPLKIITEEELNPAVDAEYNKQLETNKNSNLVRWKTISAIMPAGLIFNEKKGLVTGFAKYEDETGLLNVSAEYKDQIVYKTFKFRTVQVIWVEGGGIINNFHPDGRIEFTIRVHNDKGLIVESKRTTTDNTDIIQKDGLITVNIPLNQKLHNNDILNVEFKSDNKNLKVIGYNGDSGELIVHGFSPLSSADYIITYVADSKFAIYADSVKHNDKQVDVKELIIIEEPIFTLKPRETRIVNIALDMPGAYPFDSKQIPEWAFSVGGGRVVKTSTGINLETANMVKYIVKMKQ